MSPATPVGIPLLLTFRFLTKCGESSEPGISKEPGNGTGIAPEISWIEEILHIVIEGVNIEREIGSACDDFGNKNWVGFGYNVVKLVKTLLA